MRTALKLASFGSDEKVAGNAPRPRLPRAAEIRRAQPGAVIQPVPGAAVAASTKTSPVGVHRDGDSDVPATGAMTGSPSKTSRLAGRGLTKICGGSLCSATDGGCFAVALQAQQHHVQRHLLGQASGPVRCGSDFPGRAACSVSASREPRRDQFRIAQPHRTGASDRSQWQSAPPSCRGSACPRRGSPQIATRVVSVRRSGQEITCGR